MDKKTEKKGAAQWAQGAGNLLSVLGAAAQTIKLRLRRGYAGARYRPGDPG